MELEWLGHIVILGLLFFGRPLACGAPRPGLRSEPRHCGNTCSLTCCARLGIKPATQRSHDAADPVAPQQELLSIVFLNKLALPWKSTVIAVDKIPRQNSKIY